MVNGHLILGRKAKAVATQDTEQGVQSIEHLRRFDRLGDVDWSDLHIFQEVASAKSFRRAASALGVSVNTVRARVARLEENLGAIVFARTHEGITLTTDGCDLLELAIEMQTATSRLQFGRGNNTVSRNGELRICCTEGIGEFWLTPRIAELQDRLPDHIVVLQNDFDQKRINTSGFDLCIGFERPSELGSIVTKLGSLHFMMYASDTYVRRFGEPISMDDATDHRIVVQSAPGLLHEAQSLFLGQDGSRKVTTTRVNTSYSLFRAVANGVGIGALPTYISSLSQQVRPLDLPVRMKFDLWLSFDPSVRKSAPVRAAIDWLYQNFDVARYPWFGDKFLHPSEFPKERGFWETGTAMGERAGTYDLDSDNR
jgi:DNA-binding transcriptional LysR family regulator